MKIHTLTLTLIAITGALALASRAQADGFVGTTTQFSKVNVALTVVTNKPEYETSSAVVDTTGTARINNQTILNIFAAASGANTNEWRTNGAQLIFDWSTYQMAVADKTGTNILLYLGGLTNGTVQAYFEMDWFNNLDNTGLWDYSALTDKRATTAPGTDIWTMTSEAYFELFYDDSSNANSEIDVFGYGPNTEHYVQSWNLDNVLTKWTDSETFKPSGAGKKEIVNGQQRAAVSGTITATGSGLGNNPFIYPAS